MVVVLSFFTRAPPVRGVYQGGWQRVSGGGGVRVGWGGALIGGICQLLLTATAATTLL